MTPEDPDRTQGSGPDPASSGEENARPAAAAGPCPPPPPLPSAMLPGAPQPPRPPAESRPQSVLEAVRRDLEQQDAVRLRQRLEEAGRELAASESRAAKLDREASAHAAFAAELSDTLHLSDRARTELAAALEAQRRDAARVREALDAAQADVKSLEADKEALAAAKRELEAELAELRRLSEQGALEAARLREGRDQELAAWSELLDKEHGLRLEIEAEKQTISAANQKLMARLDECRAELESRIAETRRLSGRAGEVQDDAESARREAAAVRQEAEKARAEAELLRHEANEAMDAAQELKSRLSLQSEAERQAIARERREVEALKSELQARLERAPSASSAVPEPAAPAAVVPIQDAAPELPQSYIEDSQELAGAPVGDHADASPDEARSGLEPAFQERWWSLQGVLPDMPDRVYRILAWTAGALALVILPAGLIWNHFSEPVRDHAVPFSHPSALTWQGDVLWVADYSDESIHRMRLEGGELRLERSYPLPKCRITGLAVAGGYLYAADTSKNEIQRRRLDEALTLDRSWPVASHNISALAYERGSLYAAFARPGRIYKYILDDNLTVDSTYFSPPSLVGMSVYDGELWSADADSRLILRQRMDASLKVAAAYELKAPESGGPALSCFAMRGRSFWLGSDGQAVLRQRPGRRLLAVPVPDFSVPSAETPAVPGK